MTTDPRNAVRVVAPEPLPPEPATRLTHRLAVAHDAAVRPGGLAPNLCFAVALAAHVAVALALRHFPYQDLPNHLARYTLVARAVGGAAPAWADIRPIPTGYAALDLVGAALVVALGAAAAGKVFAVAGVVAVPLGMRRLLGAVAPTQRPWAVAGVLMSFSMYYLSSFLNYVIGVGAALAWLAAWWPRRAGASGRARAGLALGLAGLWVVHLAAPLVALVVVGAEFLCAAWPVARAPADVRRAALAPRVATFVAVAAALAVVWGGSAALAGHPPAIVDPVPVAVPVPPVVFRTPARKLLALAYPFYALSLAQAAVMAASYLVALGLFVREQGRAVLRHPLAAGAFALGAVYLVWPLALGETRATDVRWLFPAYVLPFCAAAAGRRAPSAPAVGAVAALAVLHAGLVFAVGRRTDRDLDTYDRVLARLPAAARVLPIVTPTRRHGTRIAPYRHHAMWHLVHGDGRVAGLFAADGLVDDGYPYSHLAHVRERDRVYYPDEAWGTDSAPPLPWARIWRDADVVVHAGDDDPRVRAELGAHARLWFRDGDVTVYGPPAAGAPAAGTPAAGGRP